MKDSNYWKIHWRRKGVTEAWYKGWKITQHYYSPYWCWIVTTPSGYSDVLYKGFREEDALLQELIKIVKRYERLKDEDKRSDVANQKGTGR